MDNRFSGTLLGIFRLSRLSLHLTYGALLAVIYPHLDQSRQRRVMKTWNRQLLAFSISHPDRGPQPTRGEGGCLIVANHVSWLDVLVLNAIHPSRHIVKSAPGSWSIPDWLRRRCGTVFIANNMGRIPQRPICISAEYSGRRFHDRLSRKPADRRQAGKPLSLGTHPARHRCRREALPDRVALSG